MITDVVQILGAVKVVSDQWGFTPYIVAFILVGVVGAFVSRFTGNKE